MKRLIAWVLLRFSRRRVVIEVAAGANVERTP